MFASAGNPWLIAEGALNGVLKLKFLRAVARVNDIGFLGFSFPGSLKVSVSEKKKPRLKRCWNGQKWEESAGTIGLTGLRMLSRVYRRFSPEKLENR